MYVVTVVIRAIAGRSAVLEDALLAHAENSLTNEPGCLRFDVARDPVTEDRFFLYELYEDEDACNAHSGTDHYKSYSEKTADLVAGKTVERWLLVSGEP
jgi:(4S)-4-hydroxy-5-phosphonooxypentane-2,3-dione isomerase